MVSVKSPFLYKTQRVD